MTLKKPLIPTNHFDIMRNSVKMPTQQLRSSIYKIPQSLVSLKNASAKSSTLAKMSAKFPNPAQMFPAQARMNEWILKNQDFLSSLHRDNFDSPSKQLPEIKIHNPAIDTNEKLDKVAELLESMVDVLNEQSEHQKKVEAWHEEDTKTSNFANKVGIATLVATISGIIIGAAVTIGIQFLAG